MKKPILLLISTLLILCTISGCQKEKSCSFQIISDLHYASNQYYQYTGAYLEANEYSGTGKQMKYLDDILDCYITQIKESGVNYLIISGDLTYLGAKKSHIALAEKLAEIEASGIEVYVIPGNHDIVSVSYICPEGQPIEDEAVSAEEFASIYKDFGYQGEYSYAPDSLSYVVKTNNGVRFFMLDTNLSYGTMYGKIKPETLTWLKQQLEECKKAKDTPVIIGHHNLFVHHQYFVMGYQIGNHNELEQLMIENNATLFLSGHLHPQTIVNDEKVADIATSSFAVYPHNYGTVTISNSNWSYQATGLDVSNWAKEIGLDKEDLLNYDDYGYNFFYRNLYLQSSDRVNNELSAEIKDKLLDISARINLNYFAGTLDKISNDDLDFLKQYIDGTSWYQYLLRSASDLSSQTSISYSKENGFIQ